VRAHAWIAAALVAAAGAWLAAQAPGPGGTRPEFVAIPAGPFVMGAGAARDPQAFDNERWSATQGEGTLDLPLFYISRHEVSVAAFATFVSATGATVDRRALEAPATHPAAFVSWPDALAYCRWLEAALDKAPDVPADIRQRLREGWRVTLPTEAQWEKAARGPDGRTYPWGDAPRRDRANFEGTAPMPVGQLACPECAHGLADMAGNVWEWTRSPYQPYPYDEGDDRASLDSDALWVIRGGAFNDAARLVRTSTRGAAEPGARRAFIGFRVALAAK
jgi:formylglycine-generating enzyme required for sulfatase activity